jgi:hypothetical protein
MQSRLVTGIGLGIVFALVACGGGGDGPTRNDARSDTTIADTAIPDVPVDTTVIDAKVYVDAAGVCNPLTQAGCNAGDKCTWLLDAVMPQYVGHIGCAPSGTAAVGDPCMYGAPGVTGFDSCQKGLVCGNFRGGAGVCKTICDQQGGSPMCGAQDVCVTYSGLFSTGPTTPAAGGVCDKRCDPLADNDFDGSGTALTRTGTACSGAANIGCYGFPSFGTPPQTGWSCTTDIHYTTSLVHRVQCTTTTGCADSGPTIYVNSCNQGYLPMLRESATLTTVVCVALCKPKNCYAGNCGANNEDQLGEAPHRCNAIDARGTFDTSPGGEHCAFSWFFEVDDQNTFLRSPTSDTVGFCFDHSKYLYDSNGDTVNDAPFPPCASLPNGQGQGTALGAGDVGCVDTANAGVNFVGKPRKRPDLRPLYNPTRAP